MYLYGVHRGKAKNWMGQWENACFVGAGSRLDPGGIAAWLVAAILAECGVKGQLERDE